MSEFVRFFKKTASYNSQLIRELSVGGNVLMSTEALCDNLDIKPGMKVLDLGCGKALSSVFIAKEYGAIVIAMDNFFSPTSNYDTVKTFGLEKSVIPMLGDARSLPFPESYFDIIVSINSYTYFGTDDKYLPYVTRFLKQDGKIGITDICFNKEIETTSDVPAFIKKDFFDYWYHIHSIEWWINKWSKTGLLEIETANKIAKSSEIIKDYVKYYPSDTTEAFASALRKDVSSFISFFTLIGKRTSKIAFLEEKFE